MCYKNYHEGLKKENLCRPLFSLLPIVLMNIGLLNYLEILIPVSENESGTGNSEQVVKQITKKNFDALDIAELTMIGIVCMFSVFTLGYCLAPQPIQHVHQVVRIARVVPT